MTDAAMLAAAVLVPWAAGFALVRALLARLGDGDPWVEAGYGHFVGILLVVALLYAQDAFGMRLAFVPLALALGVVAALGLVLARRAPASPRPAIAAPAEPAVLRWVAALALAMLALRLGTLAIEVLLRPLFAWDAWSQWATKAKVWAGLRDIVPFVGFDDWLARKPGYTDTAPHYPPAIPLLQTWMALALGRWDDALVNLPWLAAFVALGLGLFGQLRRLGTGTSWAIVATYLALSLPLLNVHVALAGYADFHIAAVYALAVLALADWEERGGRGALLLLVATGCLLPLLKIPGVAWLGTLAVGLVLAALGTARMRIAGGALALLALVAAATILLRPGRIGVPPAAEQQRIVESLVQHFFAFGSWNLLWYALPIVVAVRWREVAARKATAAAIACGFAFLAWTFLFTKTGDWVVDYTTVNRALLHIAPAVVAFAALLFLTARRPHGDT
jgi:hypothetical protein